MAQALSILRLIVRPGISPIAAMARWNAMLTGHTIRGMFDPADELLDRSGVIRLLSRPFTTATEVVDTLNLGELQHRQNADPSDDLTLLVFSLQ